MQPLATCVEDLSVEWLSFALNTKVRSVSAERIGTGQTSSAYRLLIDADGVPSTLVAKLAEGEEVSRRRVATAHRTEVGFYTQLADSLDVRTPTCWYGAVSDDGTEFTLILEDLAPRLPGRQVDGCSVDQIKGAVRALASLHASRWNDETLHDCDFLVQMTPDRAQFIGDLAVIAAEQFISRLGPQMDDTDVATLHDAAEAVGNWQLRRTDPFSLVHGDYRLDNLMFPPTGTDVVPVDWQTVTVSLPTRDLSYLIGTSLPIVQRRTSERELVELYHDELRSRGVVAYTSQQCFEDYRFGQLQGPMITVLGCMTSTGHSTDADAMFLAMANRSCAAIRDLGSLSLL